MYLHTFGDFIVKIKQKHIFFFSIVLLYFVPVVLLCDEDFIPWNFTSNI